MRQGWVQLPGMEQGPAQAQQEKKVQENMAWDRLGLKNFHWEPVLLPTREGPQH